MFQARLRMGRAAVSDVAGRAAAFGALAAVAALDLGFYAVVATAVLGAAVALAVSWGLVRPLASRARVASIAPPGGGCSGLRSPLAPRWP